MHYDAEYLISVNTRSRPLAQNYQEITTDYNDRWIESTDIKRKHRLSISTISTFSMNIPIHII